MKNGSLVTYTVHEQTVKAIVRASHRDGSVTVEARHELRNGEPHGCYLGYRYRMDPRDLKAA